MDVHDKKTYSRQWFEVGRSEALKSLPRVGPPEENPFWTDYHAGYDYGLLILGDSGNISPTPGPVLVRS